MFKNSTKKIYFPLPETWWKPGTLPKITLSLFLLAGGHQIEAAAVTPNKESVNWVSNTTPFALAKISVTGKVTDENNQPLPGVTVRVKNTKLVTLTDTDGRYTVASPQEGSILVFSLLGYIDKEVAINGGVINVSLLPSQTDLSEVVVVGYGTQKKANLTGAVAQITSESLENRPAPSLTRMLQGTLPNLNLKMVDGSPTRGASFNVRGITSIGAGGNALVLIDGVEGDPNMINPNDVASVTVLKDASSAAIYGSRAAFGVVLITTKSPTTGKVTVNFNTNYSINQRTVTPNVVTNGYQWAKNFDEAFNAWYDYNSHPISINNIYPFSLEYLDALKLHDENPDLPKTEYNESKGRYEYFGNTDWYSQLYKDNMPTTEQALSVSGGSEKVNYYISGRYYYQDGIYRYNSDEYNKYNVRAKGDVKVAPWLTFQNNFDLSTFSYDYPMFADGDGNPWRQFEHQGYPMAMVTNPDGTYTHTGVYTGIASYMEGNNESNQTNLFIRNTAGFVAKPWKDYLTIKGDFTYSNEAEKERRTNNFINYSNGIGQNDRFGRSLLRQFSNNKTYLASNLTVGFDRKFKKHDVKALVGYNVESSTYNIFNASRDGILLEDKPDFNLMDGLNYTINGGGNEWSYTGLFYRLNYAFNDRYLIELNGRYDGSSKFPENQRYGFFPSVSAGWRVAEEGFMDWSDSWLDNFKIRGSYGSLGNGNVAPYRYLEQMSVSKTSLILEGTQKNYTQLPGVIPDGLTWERSTTLDIGVDLNMFKNRLALSFDWYERKTQDMFTVGQPLPSVFGSAVPFGNYADLSTKGWEVTVGWNDRGSLFGKDFSYGINGSLWDSKSVITRFNNPKGTLSSTYYEGHEIGEIWGYQTEGFFQSDEEVAAHPNQKFLQNSNNNVWLAGDLKFADLNGDGVINAGDNTIYNSGDRKIIGNNAARYQFGFTLSGRWNGFGVSAFFQGIAKRDWYFGQEAGLFWGPYNRPYGYQPVKMMEDMWTPENTDAYFPRYRGYTALNVNRSLGAPQTRYLQDASYLRLKTLTVDYEIPTQWLKKIAIAKASIFVSGQNLFTLSGLFKHTENFDPEIMEAPVGDLTNGSGQGYAYPMLKTTTIGLNLNF
jgi:TonB-linked SusC/RagA family outer membrane protein